MGTLETLPATFNGMKDQYFHYTRDDLGFSQSLGVIGFLSVLKTLKPGDRINVTFEELPLGGKALVNVEPLTSG